MYSHRPCFFLMALVFTGIILINSAVFAKEKVSMAEFVKMSFQERVEVCAQLVSSEEIGHCASIEQPSGEPFTVADIKKISAPCFTGETTDSMAIAKCVRTKLDAKGVPEEFPCLVDIARAYELCLTTVSSDRIGSCTASLCTRLETR